MPTLRYVWQQTESSLCPQCDRPLVLLCEVWGLAPQFYICWDCKHIVHIGHGYVEEGTA